MDARSVAILDAVAEEVVAWLGYANRAEFEAASPEDRTARMQAAEFP